MPQIDGTNGTWDYTIGSSSIGTGLDKITIKFTPKKGTKCKKIRLIQTCTPFAYGAGDTEIPGPPEDWYKGRDPPLYRPTRPDRVKDPKGRSCYIDHVACNKDPYLDEDDPEKMTDGATQTLDFPICVFDGVIKDTVKKIVKHFVTAAICAETGEILGSIAWTSTSTATQEGKIKVEPVDKEVTPDDTFKAALKEFVKNHAKTKPGDSTLRWWCPDRAEGMTPASPFGEEVPKGFRNTWLAVEVPQLRLPSDARVGGGARFANADAAFDACSSDLLHAAVKFTWSGEQEKPIAGVVFALAAITSADIAPHVEATRQFANDFVSLRLYLITPTLLTQLLTRLRAMKPSLEERRGPAVVTLVGGIGTEESASYTGWMSRDDVSVFAKKAAASIEEEPVVLKGLNHLALNLGAGRAQS